MPPQIRGLAQRRDSLYLIGPGSILEIEEPREAVLRYGGKTRRLSPPAALYPFVGRTAMVEAGDTYVKLWSGGLAAAVRAGKVIVERARLAASRSLQLASMIADTMVPGVPYYDAVWRSPGLAVPEWASQSLERACREIPLLECSSY